MNDVINKAAMDEVIEAPKRKRGRPRMTDEEKAAAKALREAKKKQALLDAEEMKSSVLKKEEKLEADEFQAGLKLENLPEALKDFELTPKKGPRISETLASDMMRTQAENPTPGFVEFTQSQREAFINDTFGTKIGGGLSTARINKFYGSVNCSTEIIKFIARRYTQVQTDRIRISNQCSAMMANIMEAERVKQGVDKIDDIVYNEAQLYMDYPEMLAMQQSVLDARRVEDNIATTLAAVTKKNILSQYLQEIMGVGPILAGLLTAYIDIRKFAYPGNLVAYAGKSTTSVWFKGEEVKDFLNRAYSAMGTRKIDKDTELLILNFFNGLQANTDDIPVEYKEVFTADNISYGDSGKSMTVPGPVVKAFTEMNADIESKTLTVSDLELLNQFRHAYDAVMACPILRDDVSEEVLMEISRITRRSLGAVRSYATVVDEKTGEACYSYGALTVNMVKRPWNNNLKRLMYLFEQQVIKRRNNPKSLYGALYNKFLSQEIEKNESGEYEIVAQRHYAKKKFGKATKAYQAMLKGKLSDGHLMNRALRKVSTVFLCHLFEAAWYFEDPNGTHPLSYVFDELHHQDYIAPEVDYKKFYADWMKRQ